MPNTFPDYYIRKNVHQTSTDIFTISRLVYLSTLTIIFNLYPTLIQGATTRLYILNFLIISVYAFYLFGYYIAPAMGIKAAWGVFIEWEAFMASFIMDIVNISLIPFADTIKLLN